jgi:dephospho-CoA kinase
MRRVALTGGIATGKSYVRAAVAARGVPTIDSDRIVHDLLAADAGVVAEVAARFGPGVLHAGGGVDRQALGRVVFSDAGARTALEAIIHPRVYDRIGAWAAEQEQGGAAWVVADIPLLFETGRQGAFDIVVVAACSPDAQLDRLLRRDGMSEETARARLAAQWPIAEKVRLADYVIWTDGAFEATDRQVEALVHALSSAARPGRAR